MGETFDVLLIHSSNDEDEARDIADELKNRGFQVRHDTWNVRDHSHARFPEGLKARSIAILFGSDGFELWSDPFLFSFLSTWNDRREPLISVLLPGAANDLSLPSFLSEPSWVDLRSGITDEKLNDLRQRLVTGKS